MSSTSDIDRKIREVLLGAESSMPGSLARAQRVAVYAVATADRLGYSPDRLVLIRQLAELHGLAGGDPLRPVVNDRESAIVEVAAAFGSGADISGMDPEIVGALEAIRPAVSPAKAL